MMDAGTLALFLGALFTGLLALLFAAHFFAMPLVEPILGWAGAAFTALLTVLGVERVNSRREDGDE